jgi:ribose transport system permease protein
MLSKTGLLTRERILLALIAVLIAVDSALFPAAFPTVANVTAILRSLAFDGILACGMIVLLVAGTFDLSVGGTFSMAGVVAGWLMKVAGWPVPLAILAALAVALAAGLLNGLIVAYVRVNALIATLGTMGIYRGIAVLVGGPGITYLPESFSRLGQVSILGLQSPVWIMIAVAAAFHFLLSRTRFFRQYYYLGNNAEAARLSGIPVSRLQVFGFGIMGLLAGLGGIAFAARVGTSVSIAGDGAELRVITAAILGGASLTGGRGTVWGALTGVVFIALVNNTLILGSVSAYWQSIIIGVVLVSAVALDRLTRQD